MVSIAIFMTTSSADNIIEYSHDGGFNFDGIQSGIVTHVRWSMPMVATGVVGTLQFQVMIK